MESSNASQANFVVEVLAKHWRVSEPAIRTRLGVSRATWQIGTHYWLSQAEQTRAAELFQQANLLSDLDCYLKNERCSIGVPEIVPSVGRRLIEVDRGYVRCLTRNLPGFHVDVADAEIYPALAEGLARFHRALRLFSEHQATSVANGICVRTRQSITRLTTQSFVAFTPDPSEEEVLRQAAAWLLPRMDRFEQLPRQIVHGDWTPRNVLFDRADHRVRLTGVLDFEALASDPVNVDLASICSTLLMWSGLDRLDERIASVLETYESFAGVHLERADLHTAALAHWLCHYWRWRDRLECGEFGHEVKERLCLRISSVLSYVSRRRED